MAKTVNLPVKRLATEMFDNVIDDKKIESLTKEYLSNHSDVSKAAKAFIKDYSTQTSCLALIEQVTSFTNIPELTGAALGFAGLVYCQLYIVCGVASIAGKDIHSNEVRTKCIECITANAIARALRVVASNVVPVLLEKVKIKGADKIVDAVLELLLDYGALKMVSNGAYRTFIGK